MPANAEVLRHGTERDGVDEDGQPCRVQDHSGREGHGRITPTTTTIKEKR